MNKTCGFSLLSFMIYLVLFTLITMLAFEWATRVHTTLMRESSHTNIMVDALMAHDIMVRELRAAPVMVAQWKAMARDELIWHADDTDIGWRFVDGTLLRTQGVYNQHKHTWRKKITSIACRHLADVAFAVHRDDAQIRGVELVIKPTEDAEAITTLVALRKGGI